MKNRNYVENMLIHQPDILNNPIPLKVNTDGVLQISGTRVTLDTVVYAFDEGATAEEIAYQYPTLNLADVYNVIGYHKAEVDEYLLQRQELADQILKKNEAYFDSNGLRDRLLARKAEKQ
ncbi:MAG: DUF433 domain-containing protein [Desulfobacterales bacterium]|nr:DUF433 domain-containing protein [Desulfobacterales bacterium]